jgi:hypothetical protein
MTLMRAERWTTALQQLLGSLAPDVAKHGCQLFEQENNWVSLHIIILLLEVVIVLLHFPGTAA